METKARMMTFSKGQSVKLNVATCFTTEFGGERKYPLIHALYDEHGVVPGYRAPTSDELEAWRNSADSKGMDSAGETKLPPRCVTVTLSREDVFTVVRGRARMTCVWGNPRPGYTLIETPYGERCFVARKLLTNA